MRGARAPLRRLLPLGGLKIPLNPPLQKGETWVGYILRAKPLIILGGRVGIDKIDFPLLQILPSLKVLQYIV